MILNIQTLARAVIETTKETIKNFKQTPKLVIALVGNNPASVLYVNNKVKRCQEVGIKVEVAEIN